MKDGFCSNVMVTDAAVCGKRLSSIPKLLANRVLADGGEDIEDGVRAPDIQG